MSIFKILGWILLGYFIYRALHFIRVTLIGQGKQNRQAQTINEINKEYEEMIINLNNLFSEYQRQLERERIRMQQNYTNMIPKEAKLASQLFQKPLQLLIKMSDKDLQKLYREKSKIYHPDCGGNEETFKSLTNCYEYIKKVKKYNQGGLK